MKYDMTDHTKQYRLIDGHRVSITFTKEPNNELFGNIRDILLTCSDTSHICRESLSNDRMSPKAKEAS